MIGKDEQGNSHAESLSADERGVAELLRSLPHVEASKDFDFKLKARIARRQKSARPLAGLRVAGYAAPLAVGLVVVSSVFFHGSSETNEVSKPAPVLQQGMLGGPTSVPPAIVNPTISKVDVAKRSGKPATRDALASPVGKNNSNSDTDTGGRSIDTAVRPGNPILQRGFSANAIIKRNSETVLNSNATVDAGELLKLIGVDAVNESGGWRVTDVRVDSASSKSGLQKGDVIEAFDKQTVSDGTDPKSQFSLKTLRVNRAGTKISINLEQ
jgi:membrane-associated protease RseP (regulator of RpoE activity)